MIICYILTLHTLFLFCCFIKQAQPLPRAKRINYICQLQSTNNAGNKEAKKSYQQKRLTVLVGTGCHECPRPWIVSLYGIMLYSSVYSYIFSWTLQIISRILLQELHSTILLQR